MKNTYLWEEGNSAQTQNHEIFWNGRGRRDEERESRKNTWTYGIPQMSCRCVVTFWAFLVADKLFVIMCFFWSPRYEGTDCTGCSEECPDAACTDRNGNRCLEWMSQCGQALTIAHLGSVRTGAQGGASLRDVQTNRKLASINLADAPPADGRSSHGRFRRWSTRTCVVMVLGMVRKSCRWRHLRRRQECLDHPQYRASAC